MQQIIVLTRQADSYAAQRFAESAANTGLNLVLADPHNFQLTQYGGRMQATLCDVPVDWGRTVVIPRLGSTATEYSLAVLRHLEQAGVPSLTSYQCLMHLRNKFTALGELALAGLPVPDSVMLRAPSDVAPAVEDLGGYPVVLKFIRGSQGVGVIYAPDESVVLSVLEALNILQYDVLIQRYYAAAAQQDLRVIVLGNEPRWTVKRSSRDGKFRSNFHRGGIAEAARLNDAQCELALRAARVFDMSLAGVDLIEDGRGGWLVQEINSSPGFQTIERVYGEDVAGEILHYAGGLARKD